VESVLVFKDWVTALPFWLALPLILLIWSTTFAVLLWVAVLHVRSRGGEAGMDVAREWIVRKLGGTGNSEYAQLQEQWDAVVEEMRSQDRLLLLDDAQTLQHCTFTGSLIVAPGSGATISGCHFRDGNEADHPRVPQGLPLRQAGVVIAYAAERDEPASPPHVGDDRGSTAYSSTLALAAMSVAAKLVELGWTPPGAAASSGRRRAAGRAIDS